MHTYRLGDDDAREHVLSRLNELVLNPVDGPGGHGVVIGPPATGRGLVESGLILLLVAVVCVLSLLFFGDQLSSLLSLVASAV